MERKSQVFQKESCSFRRDESKRGKGKNEREPLALPLLRRSRRRDPVERMLRKVELPEEAVLLVETSRCSVKSISRRLARIHRVTLDILPNVTGTEGCSAGERLSTAKQKKKEG